MLVQSSTISFENSWLNLLVLTKPSIFKYSTQDAIYSIIRDYITPSLLKLSHDAAEKIKIG